MSEEIKYDPKVDAFWEYTRQMIVRNKGMLEKVGLEFSMEDLRTAINGFMIEDARQGKFIKQAPVEEVDYAGDDAKPQQTHAPLGDWDGEKEVMFGKHKGMTFSELPDDYVGWMISTYDEKKLDKRGNPYPNQGQLERDRRNQAARDKYPATSVGAAEPDDDDLPF